MAEYNTPSEHLDKNGNPLRGAALAARKEKIERQKTSPEEDNQKPKLESIKESVGSSLKSFFGKGSPKVEATPTPEKESGGDANAFLKIIAKNFMSIHLMARDLNVARQNSIKLVKLEGGEATNKADAQFLKAGEREAKLESERAKEQEARKPTPEKAPAAKKPKSFMDKIKEQFGINKIIKSFTKYFYLAGIILIVYDLFKESFTEWVGGLWESIKEQFDEFVKDFKKWFSDVVQPIIDKVKEIIQPIIDAVKKVVDAISQWFGEKIDLFAQEFPQTFAFIKGVIDKVIEYINIVKENLRFVTEAYDKATAKLKSVKDAIAEKLGFGKKKEEEKPKPGQPTQRLKLDEKGQFVPMTKEEVDAENKRLAARGIPPPVVYPVTTPSGKEVPAPPKPAAASTTAPTPAPTPTKKEGEKPLEVSGVQATVVKSLNESGITSPKAHANVLATVKAESNFKPQSENLNYSSAQRIQDVFGKGRIPSVEFAQPLVNNPEGLANQVYKTTDGNSAPGDGFKYRGRGFIQHTGKNQYAALAKGSGIDLLSNPDSLNSPEVAAKVIPWFFLSYKRMKPEDVENMSKVNKAIAFADPTGKKAAEREASSQQIYASMSSGASGTQVASSSSAVASEQRQQQKPTTPIVVNAPTTNNKVVNTTQVAQAPAPKDTATNLAARAT
jgi:predicted chitinase